MRTSRSFRIQLLMAFFLCSSLFMAGCGGDNTTPTTQMGGAIQGKELALATTATFAGGENQSPDGYRTSATFQGPYGITSDGVNLYVTEMDNNTIRKIVIATGAVTTLAGVAGESGAVDSSDSADGLARFDYPLGITTDGINLYVCDGGNNTIRQIVIDTGEVTTLAGGAGIEGSADGTGSAARFSNPNSIATDGTNLYVTDAINSTIRKIVIKTREVTTLAGSAGNDGATDGSGTEARFFAPNGIATDGINLYVADTQNHTIRQILVTTGEVTTLAGSAENKGSANGIGSAASFGTPRGLFLMGKDLYVVDAFNHTIRKVDTTTGEVSTPAGIPSSYGACDGMGSEARFNNSRGIVGVKGNEGNSLYVSDYGNNIIRRVDISTPENTVDTFAGHVTGLFMDVTTDGTNLYVSDFKTLTIKKIKIATGEMTTLAGRVGIVGSTDGDTSVALFNTPVGITTDGTYLYVCESSGNTIRQISIASGAVNTLAGKAGNDGSTDGSGSAAEFYIPYGITTDGTNLYVSEMGNHTIRQIVIATGAVTTLAGSAGNSGSDDGIGAAARFNSPRGITTDGKNLYVADYLSNKIRQIVIATGEVTTLVNSSISPTNITTDGINLYVSDNDNSIIHKIVIATAKMATLAGSAGESGSTDGSNSVALFMGLRGITTDGKSLYVLDYTDRIRMIR